VGRGTGSWKARLLEVDPQAAVFGSALLLGGVRGASRERAGFHDHAGKDPPKPILYSPSSIDERQRTVVSAASLPAVIEVTSEPSVYSASRISSSAAWRSHSFGIHSKDSDVSLPESGLMVGSRAMRAASFTQTTIFMWCDSHCDPDGFSERGEKPPARYFTSASGLLNVKQVPGVWCAVSWRSDSATTSRAAEMQRKCGGEVEMSIARQRPTNSTGARLVLLSDTTGLR